MPTIFEPKDLPLTKKSGVDITTLANPAMVGTNALQVERILLQPGVESASYGAEDAERFVYVIRGKGQAYVGEYAFPLGIESLLWFEKRDTFYLEAGSDGLEVLLCRAPAGE